MQIRNAVRALIIHDDKLLSIKKERANVGIYYALPGGAQELDETLEQALVRECREELGVEITDSHLLCIREYISNNHEYSFIMKKVHAIDFMFLCKIDPIADDLRSVRADIGQIGIEWLPIPHIRESLLQPDKLERPLKFPGRLHEFYYDFFVTGKVGLLQSESYLHTAASRSDNNNRGN
ncbi:NUDIX domain-containing protein [Paenibacillus piri]|nr:NUDIX domain-containing protein [Paenibacillus piri]